MGIRTVSSITCSKGLGSSDTYPVTTHQHRTSNKDGNGITNLLHRIDLVSTNGMSAIDESIERSIAHGALELFMPLFAG